MQVLNLDAKKVSLANNSEKIFLIKISIIYLLCWLVVYNDMPLPARFLVMIILLVYSTKSYQNATAALLSSIFIPFYGDLVDLSGLEPSRLLFLPFLHQSLKKPAIRNLQVSNHLVVIILVSILSLKVTADILDTVQQVPSDGEDEDRSFKNLVASYYDIVVVVCFLYFAFTRLTLYEMSKLLRVMIVLATLQAITLLYLVYQNPQMVLEKGGAEFNKSYLWRNPYFGHKNDWGMMLAFISLLLVVRYLTKRSEKKSLFFLVTLIFILGAVAISLSRQAYVWTVMGCVMLAVGSRNGKLLSYFAVGMAIIVITQPAFIMTRMDTMLNVSSAEDLKTINRKVSDLSWNQAKDNFQFLPRMFFVEWEYNWSEGFWNGMLHQQGILGFFFHIYIYIFLIFRYFAFYKSKDKKLSFYGLLGLVFVILMFLACFNRRSTHILHYKGYFTQINFMMLFIFLYIEQIRYAVVSRLRDKDQLF